MTKKSTKQKKPYKVGDVVRIMNVEWRIEGIATKRLRKPTVKELQEKLVIANGMIEHYLMCIETWARREKQAIDLPFGYKLIKPERK